MIFTYINILLLSFLTFKFIRISLEELALRLLLAVAHRLVIFLFRLVVISLHSSVAAHSGQHGLHPGIRIERDVNTRCISLNTFLSAPSVPLLSVDNDNK